MCRHECVYAGTWSIILSWNMINVFIWMICYFYCDNKGFSFGLPLAQYRINLLCDTKIISIYCVMCLWCCCCCCYYYCSYIKTGGRMLAGTGWNISKLAWWQRIVFNMYFSPPMFAVLLCSAEMRPCELSTMHEILWSDQFDWIKWQNVYLISGNDYAKMHRCDTRFIIIVRVLARSIALGRVPTHSGASIQIAYGATQVKKKIVCNASAFCSFKH